MRLLQLCRTHDLELSSTVPYPLGLPWWVASIWFPVFQYLVCDGAAIDLKLDAGPHALGMVCPEDLLEGGPATSTATGGARTGRLLEARSSSSRSSESPPPEEESPGQRAQGWVLLTCVILIRLYFFAIGVGASVGWIGPWHVSNHVYYFMVSQAVIPRVWLSKSLWKCILTLSLQCP